MSTVRQRIIDEVVKRLRSISLGGGYKSDTGLRIYEWRDPQNEPFQENELPAAWLRDESGDVQALDSTVHEHAMTLNVGVITQADNAPEEARKLESDLLRAIGGVPALLGGLVKHIQPTATATEVRQAGKRSAGVRIQFDVRYRTAAWDLDTLATNPV